MKKKDTSGWWILGAIVIVIIALIYVSHRPHSPGITTETPTTLPGLQTGNVPWIAEIDNLRARLAADNLPALAAEGTKLHIHQHLDIYIHGVLTQIPAGIGINEAHGFISPIHVHDLSNIVHVESPTIDTFTLGQFFDIWGVQLTDSCIGGYCADKINSLKIYINGAPYTGSPRELALAAHQEIVITYGTASEDPKIIPSTFTFPEGY